MVCTHLNTEAVDNVPYIAVFFPFAIGKILYFVILTLRHLELNGWNGILKIGFGRMFTFLIM